MYSLLLGRVSYGTKSPPPGQRHISDQQPLSAETPLERFFSKYPNFQFQPLNSPVVEFDRLCKLHRWKRRNTERELAHEAFQIAMKMEFDDLYGSDVHDIKNWHKLCHVLRISPVPDTLRECRAAVVKKHVNLVDLVHGSKVEVRIFKTEKQLSEYTIATGKFFPKESAKDGGVLRALRRQILNPREDTRSSRKNKSHKGLKR
jgi:hypothetical protein